MHSLSSSLARRGMEIAAHEAFGNKDGDDSEVKIPVVFMLIISLTFILMFGLLFTVSILYGSNVTQLINPRSPICTAVSSAASSA
jgi:hypothetical protein